MGLHGPDCTCEADDDALTVSRWLYLFTVDECGIGEDGPDFTDATFAAYSGGTLPGILVYLAHTAQCVLGGQWLPDRNLRCFQLPGHELSVELDKALPVVRHLFGAVREAADTGDMLQAVKVAGQFLYRPGEEGNPDTALVVACALLVAESVMMALVDLPRMGRYVWQNLADRPIRNSGAPLGLPTAPVAVGLARICAALVDSDHERVSQLLAYHADEGYLIPMMLRAVDEQAAVVVPGAEPILVELEATQRVPLRMWDGKSPLPEGENTPEMQAAALAMGWVQRRINGERLTVDEAIPDGLSPQVATLAALTAIQSYAWAMAARFNEMQAHHEGQTAA